jgi:LPXTG-motif cell wall-anchored protein
MRARLPLSALGLAVVATLVVATPATAAPFTGGDITVGGTTWSVSYLESGELPEFEEALRDDWDGGDDSFDAGLQPIYLASDATGPTDYDFAECAADGDLSPAADSTGDEIATCALEPLTTGDGTLDASYELRFFSDGVTVRSRITVTNTTGDTVSGAEVGFRDNYYQDDDTRLGASTTAGHPADATDTVVDGDLLWIIYDLIDEYSYEVPVILTAAGTSDAAVAPTIANAAGDGEDRQATLYPLPDIAPGESVEVVQFYVWNFFAFDPEQQPVDAPASTDENLRATEEVVTDEGVTKSAFLEPAALFVPSALAAVEESWDARDRFDTLSARDAAGIADPSAVLNWNPTAEPTEPELAETGAGNTLPLAALAGLLLLAGAGVIALRRRAV